MKERSVLSKVNGFKTKDGAGVSLVRVLSNQTVRQFDPLLMLDSFDTDNYDDYKAGFPTHPHRGIETITYLKKGRVTHKDSLGNVDTINDGEVQWMSAGSGIMHSETFPQSKEVLGVQLWLNLPKKDKMSKPNYKAIKNNQIIEIDGKNYKLRLLAGIYKDKKSYISNYLPFNFYDIEIGDGQVFELEVKNDKAISLFTLKGEIKIGNEIIKEKTALNLSQGDLVKFKALKDSQVLFMESERLDEKIAWGGPIVMNSREELNIAFMELENGSFIKDEIEMNK